MSAIQTSTFSLPLILEILLLFNTKQTMKNSQSNLKTKIKKALKFLFKSKGYYIQSILVIYVSMALK